LADDLSSLRVAVWWDFELYAGEDFHDAILAAIDSAKAVIVIWSPTAGKSRWVRSEASRASRQQKLVTTLAPGASLDDVPLPFEQLQCVPVFEREQIYRSLERLGVMSTVASDPPLRPPFKLPTTPYEFEEDIAGYLTLLAEAIPKRIANIDAISQCIDAVMKGPRKQRTSKKVQALAELQTLARMPNVDDETRRNIDELGKVVYHIDTDPSPPNAHNTIIKRPLHSARQTPANADFRDLIDVAALGDAIHASVADVMFRCFLDQTLLKQTSDIHRGLKTDFEELRTRYRLNKNFKKSLDTWLTNFERDFKHRHHEGHRISDFLRTERQGKAYLFLAHVARRRKFATG
jgi:hypothetical protein